MSVYWDSILFTVKFISSKDLRKIYLQKVILQIILYDIINSTRSYDSIFKYYQDQGKNSLCYMVSWVILHRKCQNQKRP